MEARGIWTKKNDDYCISFRFLVSILAIPCTALRFGSRYLLLYLMVFPVPLA